MKICIINEKDWFENSDFILVFLFLLICKWPSLIDNAILTDY